MIEDSTGPLAAEAVDAFVREADRRGEQSHAARSHFLTTRWLAWGTPPRESDGGIDPRSDTYRRWVLQEWSRASGRSEYRLELEHEKNVSAHPDQLQRLYPFLTQDTWFISQYMMGVYFALSLLAHAPNRTVVEYGVGWGNTTVAMLEAGLEVLAVDIDPTWLDLLKMRADRIGAGTRLQTLHGEFGSLPAHLAAPGAVLFYECFHHALNHDATLACLGQRLVNGGFVVFAGEPISKEFPHDWGVRMDGHSVWAMRNYGWMELGFKEDYLIRLTRRHHFALQSHRMAGLATFGQAYRAVLDRSGVALGNTMLSSEETGFAEAGASGDAQSRFTVGEARLELPCGSERVSLELHNFLTVPLKCSVEHENGSAWKGVVSKGETTTITLVHSLTGYYRVATIRSEAHVPAELGLNEDKRRLGIAIRRVRFHA